MQYIKRLKPSTLPQQNSTANTIYVDTDDNTIKVGTGASGSTERQLLDTLGGWSGQILNADGTAALPSYSFASHPTYGMLLDASNRVGISVNGTENFIFTSGAAFLIGNDVGSLQLGGSQDIIITRDAAGTLAQRNSTNAQIFRVYNTYTDASNYERGTTGWASNVFTVGTEKAGTGTSRSVRITSQGNIFLATAGGTDLMILSGTSQTLASGASLGATSPAIINTAPTVTSAGSSPSVTANNGTAAFRVNVGTGGTATTIVLAMPAATTGWNAYAENITATAANRADCRMVVQSSTTTSLTLQFQTVSTGAAKAFTASDIVAVQAIAF